MHQRRSERIEFRGHGDERHDDHHDDHHDKHNEEPRGLPIAAESQNANPSIDRRPPAGPNHWGTYRITHPIASDAHSMLFAGFNSIDGRQVVIKIPGGLGRSNRDLAKREFRALRQLAGPGVVGGHRLVRCGASYALVFDSLCRSPIAAMIRGGRAVGRLPDSQALKTIFGGLLATVARIHRAGWVHGQIAPPHVMFNEASKPILIGFSHACDCVRPIWSPPNHDLVPVSQYLAPEAIASGPSDPASDMFSIGRLLTLVLSGSLPTWHPQDAMGVADQKVRGSLPSETPAPWAELCCRLTRMAAVQRPTAESAYEILTGGALSSVELGVMDSVREQNWDQCVGQVAGRALGRATTGVGSLCLMGADSVAARRVAPIFSDARNQDARLVLWGDCDDADADPLSGFDGVTEMLATWLDRLAPTLRGHWKQFDDASLAAVAPALANRLGDSQGTETTDTATPTDETVRRAVGAIERILLELAEQRTLVLVFRNIDQMDPAGITLLERLLRHVDRKPIIIAGTIDPSRLNKASERVAQMIDRATERIV
jgi:serine/threonine protein kinase